MLKERIKQIAGYETLTPSEILVHLNVKNIEKTNSEQYTWAGIALVAGPEAAEALRQALEANGMAWAVHQFGGTGLSLDNPLVQQAMVGFRDAGVPGMDLLIETGVWQESIADEVLGRDATEEDVADALLSIQKEALETAAVDALQAFREALSSWDGTGSPPVLGA